MFMFRSKRTHLTQRLLKVRKLDAAQEDALQTHVLAQLADAQLQLLLRAVDRGDARTCCVPAPRRRRQQRDATDDDAANVTAAAAAAAYCCCSSGESPPPPPSGATRTPPSPHVLCCQTYRWPQLTPDTQLKRLPQCTTCDCCNPFHWSIVCGPESPPPPYRRYPDEKLRPEDRAPSESSTNKFSTSPSTISNYSFGSVPHSPSLPTSGEGTEQTDEWCKLAYWEQQHRIGDLFSVRTSTVHVFGGPAQPGIASAALSLSDLAPKYPGVPIDASEPIKRTRSKIGEGVLISQEGDTVWAYNLSDCPLFVNSPTLDEPHSRSLVVYKLPPGHCQRIFSWERAEQRRLLNNVLERTAGPENSHSVRISFAKGWGPKYSRQEVTVCHCWLEVLLTRPAR